MTIKRKGSGMREHSLAELRQINMREIAMHNKLNEIIDLRTQELEKKKESLYVEISNFQEAHKAELRRGIEVAMDLAARSLPWWKRSVINIRKRADEMMVQIADIVRLESARIKKEVDAMTAEQEKKAEEAREQAKKDQEALEHAAKQGVPVEVEPEPENISEEAHAGILKLQHENKLKMEAAEKAMREEIREIQKETREKIKRIDMESYGSPAVPKEKVVQEGLTPVDING